MNLSPLRYAAFGLVALIFVALLSWYFFLRNEGAQITREDAGRGAGLTPPSFGGVVGSTYENIVSSLSTLVGDTNGENNSGAGRLIQINKTPTAGFAFIAASSTTRLRFVERSTGYVFDVELNAGTLKRLTNTLVPRIHEAHIAKNAMLLREEVDGGFATSINVLNASSSETDAFMGLSRYTLPPDILSATFNPSGEEVLYLVRKDRGGLGIRTRVDGTNSRQVFSSAIPGWHVYWPGSETTVLVQKASDGVPGYAYTLGPKGEFQRLIANVPGLTLLPRPMSGGNTLPGFLYGASGDTVSLYVQTTGTSSAAVLPIRTVADKCVWHPSEPVAFCAVPREVPVKNFLDAWYRGEVHTADSWWRIDARTVSAELLYTPTTALDVEQPRIDQRGEYIGFINATDKSLWLLRIAE